VKPIVDWTDRELADFLAEKVMGWKCLRAASPKGFRWVYEWQIQPYSSAQCYVEDWQPATDLLAAGQALAKLCEREIVVHTKKFSLESRSPEPRSAVYIHPAHEETPVGVGFADKLSRALSRAMVDFVLKTEDRMEPDE